MWRGSRSWCHRRLRKDGASRGMIHGVRTAIDAAGRLVIPKEIRTRAGLQPGMPLDVRWHDGVVEIEPAPAAVTFVRKGRFVVAAPRDDGPVLTSAEVEGTREAVARAREAGS